jgi:hypothetical protein
VGPGVLSRGLGTDPDQYLPGLQHNRQQLRETLSEWLSGASLDDRLSNERARAAVLRTEPQLILGGILSAEWMNWGRPRWLRMEEGETQLSIKPDQCIRADSVGPEAEQQRLFENVHGQLTSDGWFTVGDIPAPWPASHTD